MNRLPSILICDDDSTFQIAVKHTLKGKFDFRTAYNSDEALAIIKKNQIDVLLLDIQMRTPDEGLAAIPKIKEIDEDVAIIMTSNMTDFHTVREAMRLGAADYVPKAFDPNDLAHTISVVLEKRSLLQRSHQQNFEAATTQKKHVLLGEHPQLQTLRKTIDRIRSSKANVVITGETGTGKEVVARLLRGTLPDGSLAPFVAVDSSTIQSTTAESMLFGHEKGAFTGADKTTKGIFEEADGGIVYFDEIANMPLEIQAKLLRVLQEKEVARLGSSRVLKLEFRVVCATNRDLEAMVKAGHFKDDLLQRLNVIPLSIPPLRERKDDVPVLARHFLMSHSTGVGPETITEEALNALCAYEWPGNVRELSNVMAYITAMCDQPEIDLADLPPKIRDARAKPASAAPQASGETTGTFYERVAGFEKQILSEAYRASEGNVSKLALALGMDRSHLYSKLKEYGLHSARSK